MERIGQDAGRQPAAHGYHQARGPGRLVIDNPLALGDDEMREVKAFGKPAFVVVPRFARFMLVKEGAELKQHLQEPARARRDARASTALARASKGASSKVAAGPFTRSYIEETVGPTVDASREQAKIKIQGAFANLRKRGKRPERFSQAELDKLLTPLLSIDEIRSLSLGNDVAQKKLTAFDAATQFSRSTTADAFGSLDDIWVESVSTTASGCIDAYVTASSGASTRRYVVHLHEQWSEWLVDSIKQAR